MTQYSVPHSEFRCVFLMMSRSQTSNFFKRKRVSTAARVQKQPMTLNFKIVTMTERNTAPKIMLISELNITDSMHIKLKQERNKEMAKKIRQQISL